VSLDRDAAGVVNSGHKARCDGRESQGLVDAGCEKRQHLVTVVKTDEVLQRKLAAYFVHCAIKELGIERQQVQDPAYTKDVDSLPPIALQCFRADFIAVSYEPSPTRVFCVDECLQQVDRFRARSSILICLAPQLDRLLRI